MKPVLPPRQEDGEAVMFHSPDPDVQPLPARVGANPHIVVTTEWEPTAEELALIMEGRPVTLRIWTCGHPLPPVLVEVVS